MNNIQKLLQRLENEGYLVIRKESTELYDFYIIKSKNIKGGFCTKHDENNLNASYENLNGNIVVDHVECFDKWSKCPMTLSIPQNDFELDYLIERLIFWGSEDGYKVSNEYECEKWDKSYPKSK